MDRSRLVGLAVGMLVAVVTAPAFAFPSARLIYVRGQGAEACPSEMELRLSVAHRLGYDPFNTGSRRTIMAVVERSGDRLTARMELVNEQGVSQGERRLEAPPDGCADLIRALALSMSIAIDPERTEGPLPEAPPVLTVPEPPASLPERDGGTAREAETSDRVAWRFGLGGQGAVGIAPAPVAGLLVIGASRYRNVSLAAEFRMDATGSRALESGITIESRLMAGTIAPCIHVPPGSLCVLGTVGSIEASSNAPSPEEDAGVYTGLGLRLGTEWPLAQNFVLRTHADVVGTLTPVSIELDERSVWEMSPVTGSLGLALLGSFP